MWSQMVQNQFCTNFVVMLHIKSKVMKSRIQRCKNFVPGGHVWGSLEVKKYNVGFWSYFLIVTQVLLGFLARTLKLSQVIALWMRTRGTHLEF